MQHIIEEIKSVRKQVNDIEHEVSTSKTISFGVDDTRFAFFYTELDTLIIVIKMMESSAYKESFILLRTVLEKFLFFWLMLDGRKYRWTRIYNIQPKISRTATEARDKTFEKFKHDRELGNSAFKDVIQINKGKRDDEIIITFEYVGTFNKEDVNQTGELIPMYNFALGRYRPQFAHLPDTLTMSEGMIRHGNAYDKMIKTQKAMYHTFFYIDKMLGNLILNKLIDKSQKDKILVHYNFLSTFVHPTGMNTEMYQTLHGHIDSSHNYCREDNLRELILLYTAKFMQLYIKVLVLAYRRDWDALKHDKYDRIMADLGKLSNDLWFFDNEPLGIDIELSDSKKHDIRATNRERQIQSDTFYYTDPLERMETIRSKRRNTNLT